MHELSIALSIVEMASEEAEQRGAPAIEAVHLTLGALSGVVPKALRASWELAIEATPLAAARLVITDIPAVVHCAHCDLDSEVPSMSAFICARCGTPSANLVQGREIQVTALELAR